MSCDTVNVYLPGVTRIPVAGPKPFNTLVCCTSGGLQALPGAGAGFLTNGSVFAVSNFVLQGFDQRNPPQFQHSTSAWLARIGPGDDDTWQFAVNSINGAGFDPLSGRFYVGLDIAVMFPHIPSQFVTGLLQYSFAISVCSYVLVFEPPLPPTGGSKSGAQRATTPNAPVTSTGVFIASGDQQVPFAPGIIIPGVSVAGTAPITPKGSGSGSGSSSGSTSACPCECCRKGKCTCSQPKCNCGHYQQGAG